jgi:nitroreductase
MPPGYRGSSTEADEEHDRVDVDEAIRARRTLKAFTDDVVDEAVVRELLALAVLAPNHHETEPWRFWVVGPETIARLAQATGDVKLLRSRTAIVVGVLRNDDPATAEEDFAAVACALENLMLAARARGLASFWRTPGVLDRPSFATTIGIPSEVRPIGVVHIGHPAEPFPETPDRHAEPYTRWLP